MRTRKARTVDEYIANAPSEMQGILAELRALITDSAPMAAESISYGMPFYDYEGRLVYFAAMKGYVGLYIPPPIIADHAGELAGYTTTKSAIHLPTTKLPKTLIKKLIRARMRHNESMRKR
jgi:uncharacterized protein YdhG (YjbR/CyaY superfamily)